MGDLRLRQSALDSPERTWGGWVLPPPHQACSHLPSSEEKAGQSEVSAAEGESSATSHKQGDSSGPLPLGGRFPEQQPECTARAGEEQIGNPRDFICRVTAEMLQSQGLRRGRRDTLVVRQRGATRRPCRSRTLPKGGLGGRRAVTETETRKGTGLADANGQRLREVPPGAHQETRGHERLKLGHQALGSVLPPTVGLGAPGDLCEA